MAAMDLDECERLLRAYRRMEDSREVFRPLSPLGRVLTLAGDEATGYILVETEAITFFPSLASANPSILDYAAAMNRRFYFQGLWFSVISLNTEYVRQASDNMLAFVLEHEFEMGRRYMEISAEMRPLSPEEKLYIGESARKSSAERLNLTLEEMIEEESLMHTLIGSQPLIPKPYAEMALFAYLEDNFEALYKFGVESKDDSESDFGKELYEEFRGWSDFSRRTYSLFVREISQEIKEGDRGYV